MQKRGGEQKKELKLGTTWGAAWQRVWFSALPRIFLLMLLWFIDGTAQNSKQRLDSVNQTHLVLVSGYKLVLQKSWSHICSKSKRNLARRRQKVSSHLFLLLLLLIMTDASLLVIVVAVDSSSIRASLNLASRDSSQSSSATAWRTKAATWSLSVQSAKIQCSQNRSIWILKFYLQPNLKIAP